MRCDRKRVFKREERAKRVARQMRRSKVDWWGLSAYHCPAHHGWHVGTVRESQKEGQP